MRRGFFLFPSWSDWRGILESVLWVLVFVCQLGYLMKVLSNFIILYMNLKYTYDPWHDARLFILLILFVMCDSHEHLDHHVGGHIVVHVINHLHHQTLWKHYWSTADCQKIYPLLKKCEVADEHLHPPCEGLPIGYPIHKFWILANQIWMGFTTSGFMICFCLNCFLWKCSLY